ncbi:MAG: DNA repair protein RadC [Bacteroidales bacterium]|jgi:DNA repair protein RadC|nr:DNA repair protein RadC [Bacteroidales bacterium]
MPDKNFFKIKDWAQEDRPREKLLLKGINSLSDTEILAILIGTGSKNETAVDLSKKILSRVNNNLHELGKLSINELIKNKGIGEAKAITIIAALEIGRRRKLSDIINKQQISKSSDVFEVFHPLLSDLPHEEFWILLLNRSNKITSKIKISQGGITGTVIDVKIIIKTALEKLASSIILCHNHPSGNINASDADNKITNKLIEAAKLFEIQVLDHIIIGDNKFYSYADDNKINL